MQAELNSDEVATADFKEQLCNIDAEILSENELKDFLLQTNEFIRYANWPATTNNVTWTKIEYTNYRASNNGYYKVVHLRAQPRNKNSRLRDTSSVNLAKNVSITNIAKDFAVAAAGRKMGELDAILTIYGLTEAVVNNLSRITKLDFESLSIYYVVDQICDYYYVMPADITNDSYMLSLKKNMAELEYSFSYGGFYWIGNNQTPYTGSATVDKTYYPSPNGGIDTACLLYENVQTRADLIGDIALELVEQYEYTIRVDFPPDAFSVW